MRRSLPILTLFLFLISLLAVPAHARPARDAISVLGDDGTRITLGAAPHRLISLAPSETEVLFALGLGADVVAVDANSDYPASARKLPRIASYSGGPQYEKIVALKPDLIVAAEGIYSPADIAKLRSLHLQVLVVNPTSIQGILGDITLVGTAAGVPMKAVQVVRGLQARITAVAMKIARVKTHPRVYYELDTTYYTVGHGSFMDALITMAGGVNIAGTVKNPYPQLSAEKIIAANPQYIILGDAAYGASVASVARRPGWSILSAVKDHHVYAFDDNLASRPGPRIVLGLEDLAHLLHPEVFK